MYTVFLRTWWKPNPMCPQGREPDPLAHKHVVAKVDTIEEARAMCQQLNRDTVWGARDRFLGLRYEFTSGETK